MNPGILYYRTAAIRWQDSTHTKVVRDTAKFLAKRLPYVSRVTMVSATGSYTVVCVELEDDVAAGVWQQELLVEFDSREEALDWAYRNHLPYPIDHSL